MKKYNTTAGFTMVELLIVISVTGILLTVIFASITQAKNKAADADIKRTLNDVQVKMEQYEIAPGVVDYQSALTNVGVASTIAALATKYGVSASQYQYSATTADYAVIFPLKKAANTYFCVDATRTSKNVGGLLNASGGKNCDNVTAIAGHAPTISLLGSNPDNAIIVHDCSSYSDPSYTEPGYTASDIEDGNLTSRVAVSPLTLTTDINYTNFAHAADGYINYSVSDSDGNTTTQQRTIVVVISDTGCGANPPGGGGGAAD